MFNVTVKFRKPTREAQNRKKKACSEVLLRQTQDRIRQGGDDEYRFPELDFPRPDGTTNNPLFHTGRHLLGSLYAFVGRGGFGVASKFKGAKVLLKGTLGKGGTLPTIVPKNATALFLPLSTKGKLAAPQGRVMPGALDRSKKNVDYKFVTKVDIRPRKYLRLSRANKRELISTYLRS